jgi:hypothetical protein
MRYPVDNGVFEERTVSSIHQRIGLVSFQLVGERAEVNKT